MSKRIPALYFTTIVFSFICFGLFGQSCPANHQHDKETLDLLFVPNKNQWNPRVSYKVDLGGVNFLYLEKNALTWHFSDSEIAEKMHNNKEAADTMTWKSHVYQVQFIGASPNPQIKGQGKQETYHNYFLGNDPDRWAGKVPVYHGVVYEELYSGINMAAYSQEGNFKYDFIIEPGVDPSVIQLDYIGTEGISLNDGNLLVETSVTQITEQQPYAYQMINGIEIPIECNYNLVNNIVSFEFPKGYDSSYPLIIDPVVVAATISGALTDNWGFTATFDNAGFIYAGGASFDPGFPTTTGAFQTNFGGGPRDIAVTKYNPDGSQQVYATYIGGNDTDQPHSMIVDFNGQLCIYGISRSVDYPVTSNAFQTTNAGDTEIVVTKLNVDGSALVGSTYLGGSGVDGVNESAPNTNDANRGEIILDAQNNIYVASSTRSGNFPVTQNAFQTTNSGAQDVVVLKLNSDLSALFWSTYLGSSATDVGLGIRVLEDEKVIVTGMAGNGSFPIGTGGYQSTWPGGEASAFVVKLSSNGQFILNSTYFGSTGEDYSYFVDLDEQDNVHIYGQSQGGSAIEITPDTYSFNEGSEQFLAGFSEDLSELEYSTVIGLGPGDGNSFDFIPVAFMVDKCNGIYFSGYRAQEGLPTTADAILSDGDFVFYLAKLSPNAEALEFGTYYGNANHVDGGTSRFDKAGVVYQGVCSCAPNNVLNTLPNAYSNINSLNCSIGVLKIDFEIETVTASAFIDGPSSGCVPLTIDFNYSGVNGETFLWDFDNGDISFEENPSITFTESGTYRVMQIAIAPTTCNQRDTFFLEIDVLDNTSTLQDTMVCSEVSSVFLDVTTNNANYTWQDGTNNPTYEVVDSGIYWVDVSVDGCSRRDSFTIGFIEDLFPLDLGNDQVICDENSTIIDATLADATIYEWSDGSDQSSLFVNLSGQYAVTVTDSEGCQSRDEINITFSETGEVELAADTTLCPGDTLTLLPVTTPTTTEFTWQDATTTPTYSVTSEGLYWVTGSFNGCFNSDSIFVNFSPTPFVEFEQTDLLCFGENDATITAITPTTIIDDYQFIWSNNITEPDLTNLSVGSYQVTVTSEENCTYETEIIIIQPDSLISIVEQKDIDCFDEEGTYIRISETMGGAPPYLYSINGSSLSTETSFDNLSTGFYNILTQDSNNCTTATEIDLYVAPEIFLNAGADKTIQLGDSVRIDGSLFPLLNQVFTWTSSEYVSCTNCIRPYGRPNNTTEYYFTTIDSISGCTQIDTMQIIVEKPRDVFIPNVFSPNGDGTNDLFFPNADISARLVTNFMIFDRWGEVVYEASNFDINDPTFGWDGKMNGENMNPGVFVYMLEIEFVDGLVKFYTGDVTILR